MEAIRGFFGRKWVLPVLALAVGIGLGLLYAWVVDPVEWVNGIPAQMRPELRLDYMRMAIDSYSVNNDGELAYDRYQALGETAAQSLTEVGADPGGVDPTAIQRFRAEIEVRGLGQGGESTTTPSAPRSASRYILPVCGVAVVLAVLLAGALYMQGRISLPGLRAGRGPEASPFGEDVDLEDRLGGEVGGESEPLATFRTIYTLGDDLYDDSFSIETPSGDFVGECGVGIGDLIGVGEPKKVSAFEVWLFDKNDIQTVTKVLMSHHAHSDQGIRNRLAAKGDPVEAESGGVVTLETASLLVEARIVDLMYGESPLPAESFFERLTIELRAWPRAAGPQ
jgi:hypothetical protein